MRGRQHLRCIDAWPTLAALSLAVVCGAARADCTCEDAAIEQSIREADRVFIGTPISAQLEKDAVRFVVKVDDNLRGPPQDEFALTTPRPGSCGVAIHLGMPELFVLKAGERSVSMCSGSGAGNPFTEGELDDEFIFAVTFVMHAETDSATALAIVEKKRWRFSTQENARPFFELVAKLDRHGFAVSFGTDFILYRGIELRYVDGKLESARAAAR